MKKLLLTLIFLSIFFNCKKDNKQIEKDTDKKGHSKNSDSIVKINQQDIFIGKEIVENTEFVNVKAIQINKTEIDSIYYGLYQNNTKKEAYIFTIEKGEDPNTKIIDTLNLKTTKIKVKINKFEKKNTLNLFVNNQLMKNWEFKKDYYSNTFTGKFTVSVEGDSTNHGMEMYDYQIDISEHGISLHEVNRDFCGGSYKGIEKDNKLELYYIQDKDERCVRVNSNYTIKKEGEKFYIKGIGGEGTFHQWIELKKVNKFE